MSRANKVLSWTRPTVRDLKPYYKAPLTGNPLRLDQNTNLWGANPAVAKVQAPAPDQYPSRDSDDLLAALAETHGLASDNFVVGNGSDEILDLLVKTFTAPGQSMVAPAPSYSLYPFYATLQGLQMKTVPLRSGFNLDVEGILAADAALTIIATPNNPTGNSFPTAELERIITESPGVVVLDEAYAEYMEPGRSFLSRVDEFDNLCVMRTFSKAHGLAGLRIGYLAANTELASRLRLVKPPFNLNTYSEAVAVAALQNPSWMEGIVADTIAERERMAAALRKVGMRVHRSDANFLLCDVTEDPGVILARLRNKGILARAFPNVAGLERCVRFTVGRPEHTDQLIAALEISE